MGWRATPAHQLRSRIDEGGVLERIVCEYLAPTTAAGGQSGGFPVNDIAPLRVDAVGGVNFRALAPIFMRYCKYL